MASSIWFPFKFPHLNQIILDASTVHVWKGRTGKRMQKSRYTEVKARWTSMIRAWAKQRGFEVLPGCWHFTYLFVEENAKRDPDNIASGAVKIINDGLVKGEFLENDGWGQVRSIRCFFASVRDSKTHGLNKPGVCLSIGPEQPTEEQMLEVARILSSNVPSLRTQAREKAAIKAMAAEQRAPDNQPDPEGVGSPGPAGT